MERVKKLVTSHYERVAKSEREKKLAKVAKLGDALRMSRERTLELLTEHGLVPKSGKVNAAEMKEAVERVGGCIERLIPAAKPFAKVRAPYPSVNAALLSSAVRTILNLKVESVEEVAAGIVITLGDVARKPKPDAVAKKLKRLEAEEKRAAEKMRNIKRARAEVEREAAVLVNSDSDSDEDYDDESE